MSTAPAAARRAVALVAVLAGLCAVLVGCDASTSRTPTTPAPLSAAAKAALVQACADRTGGTTEEPASVLVLVWNGRRVSGSLPMTLAAPGEYGVERTATDGCYRITEADRCESGRTACATPRFDVGRHPLADDNDVNVAFWGAPTDDTWFPASVPVPPVPASGVDGAVVTLVPAGRAEGHVAGLPKGARATVYALDAKGRVQRVSTATDAFALGGLRAGDYTFYCTARDGFPYDFGRPDTPTGRVTATVPSPAAPDTPPVHVPTCRPTGPGSPELVAALKAWRPGADLGGGPRS